MRVTLDNVLIVRRTDLGWFCEIDQEFPPTFIGRMQVELGHDMPAVGERGRVVLTVDASRDFVRPTPPGDPQR